MRRSQPHAKLAPLLCLTACLWSSTTQAQATPEKPPEQVFQYLNASFFTYNSLGLVNRGWFTWRNNLYLDSDALLLSDCHISTSAVTEVSPAFGRLKAEVEVKPLAILEMSATYEGAGFFGTFHHLQFLPTANAPHFDDDLKEGKGEPTLLQQLTLTARLQGKVGPIAARSKLFAVWIDPPHESEQRVFYEPTYDTLVAPGGWLLTTDTDVIYVGEQWTFGLRHTWLKPLLGEDAVLPGEDVPDLTQHRLGPLVAWRFADNPGQGVERQTLFALVSAWLKHPQRDTAIPFVALGYIFQGRIFP
jgi:hypothetical protein